MRHCPKCNLQFDDQSKICRSCDAILDEALDMADPNGLAPTVVEVLTVAKERVALEDVLQTEPPAEITAARDWICTRCGESVPATFDVCWNCENAGLPEGEAKDAVGAIDKAAPALKGPAALEFLSESLHEGIRSCPSCGSSHVIPNVAVADTGDGAAGYLAVYVDAAPGALIFKNRRRGELVANICGACGYVELRVRNPAELYEHYLRSRE